MPHLTTDDFYHVWAAVGPLVGVIIGGWLSARWQRRKWILDNKTTEYRGILDALNSYRFVFVEYCALYKIASVAVSAQKKYDDDIALARAQDAVTNAFADRIFTRTPVAQSGVRNEWSSFADKLLSAKPPDLGECLKMLDGMHDKLVKVSELDLKLPE
jgi:hypothetical protein